MQPIDVFIYGALLSICENQNPITIGVNALESRIGIRGLSLVNSIRVLESKGFIKSIWHGENIHIQAMPFVPEFVYGGGK